MPKTIEVPKWAFEKLCDCQAEAFQCKLACLFRLHDPSFQEFITVLREAYPTGGPFTVESDFRSVYTLRKHIAVRGVLQLEPSAEGTLVRATLFHESSDVHARLLEVLQKYAATVTIEPATTLEYVKQKIEELLGDYDSNEADIWGEFAFEHCLKLLKTLQE